MAEPLQLVIIGGGTAGWMCAAACAAKLVPAGVRVRLVESEEIGTVGVGEATLPQMKDFNDFIGLDEVEFMKATQASFKLGIEFVNWGHEGQRYIHPFGTYGRPVGEADFFSYWIRARRAGFAAPLGDYCFPIVTAWQNRFLLPNGDPNDVRSAFAYAYHLDAFLYARYLRRWAEARGIERIEGRIIDVERDGQNGGIVAVKLASGERVVGDFFVDCSGFRSLLLGSKLGVDLEDWSHWLPCDSAQAVPCARSEDFTPYTRSTRRKAGWQWRIPLQHRTGNGYVFSSAHIGEEEAASVLLANLDGTPQAEPRLLKFRAGKRRKAWNRNVVAIGLASGFLEPLESTSIHLIQSGITRLLDFLPAGPIADADRDAYNRLTDFEIERIRDFVILHYAANRREGEPMWDALRHMALPEPLANRIAMFRANGRIAREHDELFDTPGWIQVMAGQGIVPKRWHPLADALSTDELDQFLSTVAGAFARDAARMPGHADYLARFCAPSILSQSSIA